ncbi:myo-inosose-2 dehydratase [bacterium]|nr:myo-inosose-2 dehydratase [bacterium]
MLNKKDIDLGIAPIGWTNDDLPELGGHIPFEQCISEMAQAGYTGTEVGNKYPREPEELKRYLNPLKLRVASAWFSTYFTEGKKDETIIGFQRHMEFLKEMGASVIVVCECGFCIQGKNLPVLEEKPVFNNRQWELLKTGLEGIGQMAAANRMKIVYHHHMGTGVQTRAEIDHLLGITDPQLIYLLLDTGHITYSGDDALILAEKYGTRIKHVHLKDIRRKVLEQVRTEKMSFLDSVKAGVFTVPGDGMIDFIPLFKLFERINYQGWMVVEAEQDSGKANPLEYARKAREYILKNGGI